MDLTELLWEQKVGTHTRAAEREREKAEAKKLAAYDVSRQQLLKRQGGVLAPEE